MPDNNASTRRAQARSLPTAVAWGEDWAHDDVQLVAAFPDLTAEELGLAVGRTVYAVQSLRERLAEGAYGADGRRRPVPAPAFRFTFAKGWRD
jgi:hypothetical protein